MALPSILRISSWAGYVGKQHSLSWEGRMTGTTGLLDHLSLKFEQSLEYLRHLGPADAEVAGERRPALELAGVEQGLVISGQLKRIAAFLRDWFWFGCGVCKH